MTKGCHEEVIVSSSLVRGLRWPPSCCDFLTSDDQTKHWFLAKWLNVLFSVCCYLWKTTAWLSQLCLRRNDGGLKGLILQTQDHWSETHGATWKHLPLNIWENCSTDSQSIFSPPARLILSQDGSRQPRRLPTSHFCIYVILDWASSQIFFFSIQLRWVIQLLSSFSESGKLAEDAAALTWVPITKRVDVLWPSEKHSMKNPNSCRALPCFGRG